MKEIEAIASMPLVIAWVPNFSGLAYSGRFTKRDTRYWHTCFLISLSWGLLCSCRFQTFVLLFYKCPRQEWTICHHCLWLYLAQWEASPSILRFQYIVYWPWLKARLCETRWVPTHIFSPDNINSWCLVRETLLSSLCQVRVSMWQWYFQRKNDSEAPNSAEK